MIFQFSLKKKEEKNPIWKFLDSDPTFRFHNQKLSPAMIHRVMMSTECSAVTTRILFRTAEQKHKTEFPLQYCYTKQ